jgi:ATP-binding cassette subfamily C protein LapB
MSQLFPTPEAVDQTLLKSLVRLAELQREAASRLAIEGAVVAAQAQIGRPVQQLKIVCHHLGVPVARWHSKVDESQLPALAYCEIDGWRVLIGKSSRNVWISQVWDLKTSTWTERSDVEIGSIRCVKLQLIPPFTFSTSPVFSLVSHEILANRGLLLEAALGGLIIGVLGLITSLYSMQIYDRVIPTGASQTLLVLSLGAFFAVLLEWLARVARMHLYERLIEAVDQRMTRSVYLRLLSVRLDQLPRSVGSLAAQMRGYEMVRSFLTQASASVLVDLPFATLFLVLIAAISGPLALIPLMFFVVALVLGLSARGRMEAIAKIGAAAGNFKTGLLVETVEGAETIKSGQGGWRMLARWLKSTDEARDAELNAKRIGEHFQHIMIGFQQFSYISLVACGAWLVSRGELTMGGLIACSILAGRVLNPVSVVASQALQWAHAKAALEGLDAVWKLEDDHHGHEPILLDKVQGNYLFDDVVMRYGGFIALTLRKLAIRPGERIGIVGPVGAGKTTFLRLLSGMYKPQAGRIFLDDVDLSHISKPLLAENMAYLQQEGRLFAGTLRENLLLGMVDPGDAPLLEAARQTGLLGAVVTPHPKGLQQEIFEGGTGLSGGQRQLVSLTRIFLRNPRIWLLDEPTANVDGNLEFQIMALLQNTMKKDDTLVLVTHKPDMLRMVQRIIVIANHQIVMDGPRDEVLSRLNANVVPLTSPLRAEEVLS